MSEPIEVLTLYVPRSSDNPSEFARIADILDHLATTYGWHPEAYAYLLTRAEEARQIAISDRSTSRI